MQVGHCVACLRVIMMTLNSNIYENDEPCMLAIVWPAFDDYDDNELNV